VRRGRTRPESADSSVTAAATSPLGAYLHSRCIACGRDNPHGLALEFERTGTNSVATTFNCHFDFQGYEGQLHGGIAALLLDSAMTNCLFALGLEAVTAELVVRYRNPIVTGHPVQVSATIARLSHRLFVLDAKIEQDGLTKIAGQGKFLPRRA